ncbi:MAG: hypothetical protein K5666_02255 [Bacilli bacterium]|nr:hypothetical protein [Bacilli bacterium]
MKVIKCKKNDLFDDLLISMNSNETEKMCLVYLMTVFSIAYTDFLKNPVYFSAFERFNQYAADSIIINNKENDIYAKMLRYLQLLKTNGRYEQFKDTTQYLYFDRIVKVLKLNRQKRYIHTTLEADVVEMTVKTGSKCELLGNMDFLKNILTDDLYHRTLNSIPRK